MGTASSTLELPEITICIHTHGKYTGSTFDVKDGVSIKLLNASAVNAVHMVSKNSTKEMQEIYDEYIETQPPISLEEYIQIHGFALKQVRVKHGLVKKDTDEDSRNFFRSSGWGLVSNPTSLPDMELFPDPSWEDITILGSTKGPLKTNDKILPGRRSRMLLSQVIEDLTDRGYVTICIVNLACGVFEADTPRDARAMASEVKKTNPSTPADPKWFKKGGTKRVKKRKFTRRLKKL